MVNLLFYKKIDDKIYIHCPECRGRSFTYDEKKQELICDSCDLVVRDNGLITLQQRYNEANRLQRHKRKQKKKGR